MMLNTDLHNPNIPKEKKMKPTGFVRNTRKPATEADPGCSPERMLEIYHRIANEEITMKSGEGMILKPKQAQYDLPDSLIGHVVIKSLWEDDEDDPNLVGRVDVAPAGRLVTGIHGGQLLGLELPAEPTPAGKRGFVSVSKAVQLKNFQWFDWQTLQPVGTVLPAPSLLAWDPELQYCLSSYKRSYVIWALVPTIRYIRRVRSQPVVSALWHFGRLLYATATQICCLHPTHADEGPTVLASFGAAGAGGSSAAALFAPSPRPRVARGSLALLRVVQDTLVFADADCRLHGIELGQPGLALRQLIVQVCLPPTAYASILTRAAPTACCGFTLTLLRLLAARAPSDRAVGGRACAGAGAGARPGRARQGGEVSCGRSSRLPGSRAGGCDGAGGASAAPARADCAREATGLPIFHKTTGGGLATSGRP